MLGIADNAIWIAYLLCVISAVVCVVYGIKNWNNGLEREQKEIEEELRWEETEHQIEENL